MKRNKSGRDNKVVASSNKKARPKIKSTNEREPRKREPEAVRNYTKVGHSPVKNFANKNHHLRNSQSSHTIETTTRNDPPVIVIEPHHR